MSERGKRPFLVEYNKVWSQSYHRRGRGEEDILLSYPIAMVKFKSRYAAQAKQPRERN